jgi:Cu-processing system permease protein
MGPGLRRIGAVAANTFRETVRERVLYNLVFFAILMTLSGLLLQRLSIRQDEKIIKDVALAAMDFFGTLIAVFVGVGLVGKEIERRSLYPLLAKPVSRVEFLLGKFLGLASTLFINVAVMTVGLYLTLLATKSAMDPALLGGIYAIYLGLLVTVAVALVFSSSMPFGLASVCTVGVVVGGRFTDVIRHIADVAPGTPGWLTESLYYIIPNYQTFDFKASVAYGEAVPAVTLVWVTAYAIAYGGILLAIGLHSFRRRNLV